MALFDELKAGMSKSQVESILRRAGLTVLPAAQNYDHVMRGDRILESPNGHPLRVMLDNIDDSTIRQLKRALGY